MILLGQVSLLTALVAAGYASYAALRESRGDHRDGGRRAVASAVVSFASLTCVLLVLAYALIVRDFQYAYVAQYSSAQLAWQYSLSALWVGQAGSLLLWVWFLELVALVFLVQTRRQAPTIRLRAFSVLWAYAFFLTAILVFAADPLQRSLTTGVEGNGMSPLLMHPAMLMHPPVVFLGYAAWGVPFALALAALSVPGADTAWLRIARPWTLFAWVVLGSGILLGGNWAYEELGWGGYWAWDPVENGSLIPWLTGTALIHCLLGWHYRGVLKRTTIALAVITFTLCNFATFLTRSGIFSSLHAFSRSPIGWAFLGMMVLLFAIGATALLVQRHQFAPDRLMRSVWSRESLIATGSLALLLLTLATLVGTLMVPLSDLLLGKKIIVGAAFFNYAAMPVGWLLLCGSAATPLLRWGVVPSMVQRRLLTVSIGAGGLSALVAFGTGQRHLFALATVAGAVFAVATLSSALWLDVRIRQVPGWRGVLSVLRANRPRYASYFIHLGFTCLVVGIAGSSLGSLRENVVLREGETMAWAGYTFQLAGTREYTAANVVIGDVQLEITRDGQHVCTLWPARHLHRFTQEWTTEVAIHSTWLRDLLTILHGAAGVRQADLTLVINPLVRWIWLGGWLFLIGSVARLWPASSGRDTPRPIARPKFLKMAGSRLRRARV